MTAQTERKVVPDNELSEKQLRKLVADGVNAAKEGSGFLPVDSILHARRRTALQAEKNAEAPKASRKNK